MKVTSSLLLVALAAARAESPHLANIRQLTFAGQNAEAYWSPGGNRLIYQSTIKPLECDQIFIMNSGRLRPTHGVDRQGPLHLRLFPA